MDRSMRMKKEVPEEILGYEIFTRLDVKCLLRIRSVCKLWLSLIDDPEFVQTHHNRSKTRPGGTRLFCDLFNKKLLKQVFYSAPAEGGCATELHPAGGGRCWKNFYCEYTLRTSTRLGLRPSESVNGLLLLYTKEEMIYLCNPSTQETILLPPTDTATNNKHLHFESVHETFCGLGFDPCAGVYKVLRICRFNARRIRGLEFTVLTLSAGGRANWQWRKLDCGPTWWGERQSTTYSPHAVFVNGAIHYMGSLDEQETSVPVPVIVAFQVRDEKFHVFAMPGDMSELGHKSYLGNWRCKIHGFPLKKGLSSM